MPRFFVSAASFPDIVGPDVHHIRDVLRLKPGSLIELVNDQGQAFAAQITSLSKEKATCQIIKPLLKATELKTKITLAQALPKGQKMDWLVEKATELGVCQIIPTLTERTIVPTAKLPRWRKLAKAAAQQSGRLLVPTITEPTKLTDLLQLAHQYDLAIIPWEKEAKQTLPLVLKTGRPKSILALVGPEGGFSNREIAQATAAGFIPVSLGPRILRTETAGLAIVSLLAYELG